MSGTPRERRKAGKNLNSHLPPPFYDLLPIPLKSGNYVIKFDTSRPTNRFLVIHRTVKRDYRELHFHEKVDLYNTCIQFCRSYNLGDSVITIPIGQWSIPRLWNYAVDHFTALLYIPDRQIFVNTFLTLCKLIPHWPNPRYVTPFWLPGSYNNCETEQYIHCLMTSAPNKKMRFESVLRKQSCDIAIDYITKATQRQPLSIKLVTSPNFPGLRGFKHDANESLSSSLLVRFSDALYDYAVENMNLKKHGCSLCISLSGPFELGRHTKIQGFIKNIEFSNRYNQNLSDISERSSESDQSDYSWDY